MKKAFCANCRGPLNFEPGAEVAKCGYCGHQQPVGRRQRVAGSAAGKSAAPKIILVVILVAVGAGIALPIWITSRAMETVDKVTSKVTSSVSTRVETRVDRRRAERKKTVEKKKQVYAPADFDKAPNGRWFPLDTAGMKGTLKAFDPIANFDWFMSVAKEWSPDAALDSYGFALSHLSATTATVDVMRKGSVDIRFASKARREAADKLAEVSEETVPTKFRIWIRDGEAQAMKSVDRSPRPARRRAKPKQAPVLTCSTAQVLEAAQKSKRLPKRPFYSARLYAHGKRWAWSVSADGGGATVKPDQCK